MADGFADARSMMRHASIAAVARHDAVRLCGYPLAGLQPRRRPGTTLSRRRLCGQFFLAYFLSCHPLKTRGGGGPAADL